MSFGTQTVGTTSTAQTLTLRNSGTIAFGLSAFAATGEFAETHTCGDSLAAAATCTVSVTFTPTAVGTRTGSLTITDGATDSPQFVPLAGTGGTPQIALEPTSLGFSTLVVSTTSKQLLTLTVRNSGGSTVTVSSISTTGDYTQTNTCTSPLIPGGTCAIIVTFSPSFPGSRAGTVTITDDAPGSPRIVPLTGTGLTQGPTVVLLHNPLTFPNQAVGSTSTPSSVQFTNVGTETLTIAGIAASGDFVQTNACDASLAPNGFCTLNVTFTPTAAGIRTGTITITDNAASGSQAIALSGTGTDASSTTGPLVGLSPASLTFPNQAVRSASPAQSVTLTNSGAAALTIASIAASGDFAQTNTCGSSVPAGGTCTVAATFTPNASGPRTGMLTITDTAPGSPHSVFLTGTGTGGSTAPAISLSSTAMAFDAQPVGVPSSAQTATVTNSGTAPLTITAITVDGDYSETDTCGYSIAAGASCTVSVAFAPTAVGTRTGRVTIVDDAAGSPRTITLAGTGALGRLIVLSPSSLAFGSRTVGTTSDALTVTVTNNGATPVAIVSLTATGDFGQTNTCGETLDAGGSCTVSVTFTPSATGTRTGTVAIVDDAPGSPHVVIVSGTGAS